MFFPSNLKKVIPMTLQITPTCVRIKKTFMRRGLEIINEKIPSSMKNLINLVELKFGKESRVSIIFKNAFVNTYQTTLQMQEDGTTFVITGDIPAMWNRDSVAQVRPLLNLIEEDESIKLIIKGIITMHKRQILLDPYANAHNLVPRVGEHSSDDLTKMHELVWERKYEVDSLCYPIQLTYLYWKKTDDDSIFDNEYLKMVKAIIKTFIIEQEHSNSEYSFRRIADWLLFNEPERIKYETLPNRGHGSDVAYTGMTWSGFRPSDDACQYGYLIPANMFVVVVLRYLNEIVEKFYTEQELLDQINKLRYEVENGIKKHGVIKHPKYGEIFAYEVDGLGNYNLMDDANVPSLLSAPYLGYCEANDPVYINTRNFILSQDNPYYYEGKCGKGVGSPHTPENYFWHIALAIEGLTTANEKEKVRIMNQFINTTGGTNLMHEGVDVNNSNMYTRPWFSWANSIYSEFILKECGVFIDSNGKN